MQTDFRKLSQSFTCDSVIVDSTGSSELTLTSSTNESVYVSLLCQQSQECNTNSLTNAEDIFMNVSGNDGAEQSSNLCHILLPEKQAELGLDHSTKEATKLSNGPAGRQIEESQSLIFSYGVATLSEHCLEHLSQMMPNNLTEFLENLCKASLLTCEWSEGRVILKGPWNFILEAENLLKNLYKEKLDDAGVGLLEDREVKKTANDVELLVWDKKLEQDEISQEKIDPNTSPVFSKRKYRTFAPKKDYEALAVFKHFCHLCSFKSKRESHFKRHLQLHEKNVTIYRCTRCNFRSIRLSHIRKHEVSHSTAALQCSQCSYSTDQAKLLKRHLSKHKEERFRNSTSETKQETLFPCSICAYQTAKFHLYQRHLRVHTAGNEEIADSAEKPFQCEQCDYQTWRKEHYTRHIRAVHTALRNHLCQTCGKAFKRRDGLTAHLKTHVKPNREVATEGTEVDTESNQSAPKGTVSLYSCKSCRRTFRTRAHMQEHMTVHSNDRDFLCEICGASFKTRSVQRKHVATIHQRPRSYACNICPKRFNTNFALRRHSAQHQKNDQGDCVEPPTTEELDWPVENLLLPVPVVEAHSLTVNEAETLFYLGSYQS